MEKVDNRDIAPGSPDTTKRGVSFGLIAVCIFFSLVSGAAGAWWFSEHNKHEIYVVDLKKIVDDKKQVIIDNYKKNPTAENGDKLDKELADFLRRLDYKIVEMGSERRIVFIKDALLSGETLDATEEVKAFANGKN